MKKALYFFISLCLVHGLARAQSRFVSPVAGIYKKDFLLINYVDWDTSVSIRDHYCTSKTYNGHQGTDFVLRSFRVQDSGLVVRAADNGRIIFVQDGIFDREKTSVIAKQLGNYIGISHSGKLQTYYGHLRKGSITVKVGDSVVAGQKIGLVGSSGNSESPHLHFELWYDSTYYIDPFSGPCGNAGTYWKSEPSFDTSYGSWTSGMCNYVCTLDTLKEEPLRRDTFYTKDPAITYWNLQYGIRKNDSLRAEWYNPSGTLWWSYGYKSDRDYWYGFFWSHIATPSPTNEGKWTVKYYRNNLLTATKTFYFYNKATSIGSFEGSEMHAWKVSYDEQNIIIKGGSDQTVFKLYNIQGELVRSLECKGEMTFMPKRDLAPGVYLLENTGPASIPSRNKVILF